MGKGRRALNSYARRPIGGDNSCKGVVASERLLREKCVIALMIERQPVLRSPVNRDSEVGRCFIRAFRISRFKCLCSFVEQMLGFPCNSSVIILSWHHNCHYIDDLFKFVTHLGVA